MPLRDEDMQKIYTSLIDFTYNKGSWNNLARQGQAISPKDHEQIDYRARMLLKSDMTAGYHCDGNNPPSCPVHRVGGYIEYVRNKQLGSLKGTTYTFHYNFVDGIKNFQDTVLILGGSCSTLGYQVQLQYTKPHFANCEVVEIKKAGHRMNMEQIDDVMMAIKPFLKEYLI